MTASMDASRRRVARACRVELFVAAPVESVWRVVADVTRTGEWSYECHHVTWLDGRPPRRPAYGSAAATGRAGFAGAGPAKSSPSTPHTTSPGAPFPTPLFVDSTDWRIDLQPADAHAKPAR